ncbi:hypothetical protein GCM10011363_39410 [Marivita lacus]|uniref:Uncharacterized protein n=1 Tax=Marivita lacus TaxID=1323742 RepID=A0ABQ1L4M2_9RHOB|nr:hypothetical protein GCM10011363_39410 [Marivita lacus]
MNGRKSKRIPPHRPLAEIRAQKRKQYERNKGCNKSDNRETTNGDRIKQGDDDHHCQCQTTKHQLSLNIMKICKAVSLGQGW